MNRIRTGAITYLLAFLTSLTLGACSVVRVDVDVYNGPLANHEEVQVEQLAAMVMGARPLLAQLRDTLQWHDACQAPDAEKPYSKCILKNKNRITSNGLCQKRDSVLFAVNTYYSDVAACELNHPAARVNELIKLYLDRSEPVKASAKTSEATASVASEDPELDTFRTFKKLVEKFRQQFDTPGDNGDEMKKTAYDMTNMLNLLETWNLIYEKRESVSYELYNAIREIGNAGRPNIFEIPSAERKRIMDFVLFFYGPEAASDIFSLAKLQHKILLPQISKDTNNSPNNTSISKNREISKPTTLENIEIKTAGSLKAFYPRDRPGALQRGRLDEGLATLIENYLVQKRTCISKFGNDCALHGTFRKYKIDKPIDAPSAALLMQEAIVRFANKLVTIADHEILLQRGDDSAQRFTGFAAQQFDENIVVLQAIGNSILSQADEIHRRRNHEVALRGDFRKQAAIDDLKASFGIDLDFEAGDVRQSKMETTVEVLDQLINRLKFMHLAAVAAVGNDECVLLNPPRKDKAPAEGVAVAKGEVATKKAKNTLDGADNICAEPERIEAAIKLAYEYRSGMVYIRPPSAYLRQVFAASGLQDNSGNAWSNMLDEQGARSAPLSGIFGFEWLRGEKSSTRQRQVRAEIDKQFWNNINSVRLAGFGATNFVLVKDDVGNWYAKNVEADPSQIYQSVQSSLLFAVGGNVNADLLLQRNLEREALAADGGSYTKLLQNKQYVELRNQNRARFDGTSSGGLTSAFQGLRDEYVGAINSLAGDVQGEAVDTLTADLNGFADQAFPAGPTDARTMISNAFGAEFQDSVQAIDQADAPDLDQAARRAEQIEKVTAQLSSVRDALVRRMRGRAATGDAAKCGDDDPATLQSTLNSLQVAETTAEARLAAFMEADKAQPGQFVQKVNDAKTALNLAKIAALEARVALEDCREILRSNEEMASTSSSTWNSLADRVEARINRTLQSWMGRQVAALDSFEQAIQVMSKVAKGTADASSAQITPPPADPNGAASAAVSVPDAQ